MINNQNNAAQPGLTDDDIRCTIHNTIGFEFMQGELQQVSGADLMNVAHALLSKVRAEGVQAGDERVAFEAAWRDVNSPIPMNTRRHDDGRYAIPDIEREWRLWQARAALASAPVVKPWPMEGQPDGTVTPVDPVDMTRAPVAGEARMPPGHTITRRGDGLLVVDPPSGKQWVAEIQTPVGQFITAFLKDSAPQASEAVRDAEDAARWRAFIGCARIRPLGSAGLEQPDPNNYAHMGLEIWTVYGRDYSPELLKKMDAENERGRRWLVMFADVARAALSAQPGAQTPHPKQHNDGGAE